ncbi:MAG: hypothetical protein ACOVNY_01965 [Chitinophagaceae bacterium]
MKLLIFVLFLSLYNTSNCSILNNDFQRITKKNYNEKQLVKTAAINTLKWFFNVHNKTQRTFNKFYIKGNEGDFSNPYRIDFDGVREYFGYLKKTDLFSQKFFDDLFEYFKKCDSNFIVIKQFEKIPIGFEYNLITKDMDDVGIEENINTSVISSYKKRGNTVHLSLKFDGAYTYIFVLTKHKNKWLVDNINGDFRTLNSKPI